jgi:hypothetical protein
MTSAGVGCANEAATENSAIATTCTCAGIVDDMRDGFFLIELRKAVSNATSEKRQDR